MPLLNIFRSGTHTCVNGRQFSFSPQDIEKIAAAYDPAIHEAPIVIGHPALDAPAYGWIDKLQADGHLLLARPHQLDPQFAGMVRDHRYKKVSAAFYTPGCQGNPTPESYYLKHVGFLGATPPAIKGLKSVSFSEADHTGVITIEFAESDESAVPEQQREATDNVTPVTQTENPPTPLTEETPVDEETDTSSDTTRLADENAALKKQLDELNASVQAAARNAAHQQNAAFAESLIADAKLAPAGKSVLVAVLDALTDSEEGKAAQFAEADGTKKPLVQALKEALTCACPVINFAEMATQDSAADAGAAGCAEFAGACPDRLALHNRAMALAKNESISYQAAVKRLV